MNPGYFQLSPPVGLSYSCVRIHPEHPILLIGTSDGRVVVYHLDYKEKITEIKFTEVSPFGDESPVHGVVVEVSYVTSLNSFYIFLDRHIYVISAESYELRSDFPVDSEIIAGCIDEDLDRMAVLTKRGELSSWKLSIELNLGTYEVSEGFPGIQLDYVSEDQVLIIYPDGKVWLVDLGERSHRYIENYDGVIPLIQQYFSDSNEKFSVSLTQDGHIDVYPVESASAELSHLTAEQPRPLHGVHPTVSGRQESAVASVYSALLQQDKVVSHEEVKITERVSKDRYHALAQELSKTSDLVTVKQEVEKSDPDLTLAQAVETYLEYKTGKTRSVLLKLCTLMGLDAKATIVAYRLNGRRSRGLIDFSRQIRAKASKRQIAIWYLLGTVYILLFVGFFLYTMLLDNNLYIVDAVVSVITLFLIYRWHTINRHPRIKYLDELRIFKIFAIVSVISLDALLVLDYMKIF